MTFSQIYLLLAVSFDGNNKRVMEFFEEKIYRQIDGVAMGPPIGPTLANAFLCFHGQI